MAEKPTTLGARIDRIWSLQQALEKWEAKLHQTKTYQQVQALKMNIDTGKEQLLHQYEDADLTVAAGHKAKLSLKRTETYSVVDWLEVVGYMKSHDAFDLVHKRVSAPAVREREESGETVPGVQKFVKKSLTIRAK